MVMQTRWFLLGSLVVGSLAGCGDSADDNPTDDAKTSDARSSVDATTRDDGAPNDGRADGRASDGRADDRGVSDGSDARSPVTTDASRRDGSTDTSPAETGVTEVGAQPDGALGNDADRADTATADPCRGTVVPTDQHYAPPDLCVRAVGKVADLRQITFAPDGALFGTTKAGRIVRMFDLNGNGTFEDAEIVTWAQAGSNGNNCHIDADAGFLYAGFANGVKRWKWTAGSTAGTDMQTVLNDAPAGGNHPLHTTHVWSEGGKKYLYVMSGSAGNASPIGLTAYDTERSLLKRFDLSKFTGTALTWASGETISRGLRNMVGFNRDASGRIYGVVNGMDNVHYEGEDVHNDNPGEQLVRITSGTDFGFPFCFTAQRVVNGTTVIPAGTQLRNGDYASSFDDAWCATNSRPPTTFFQAHSAPLDLVFFDGTLPTSALPSRYRGGAFAALHGSWNRTPSTGYAVVWVPFDAQGNAAMPTSTATTTTFHYEVVFGGGAAGASRDGSFTWSAGTGIGEGPRPAGVAVSPFDGALYAASDSGGYVYRIGTKR